MVMIVAATVVTTMNMNITIDIYVGVSIDIHVGVSINVFGSIDIGIAIDITVVINVGARMSMHLPGHCVLGQHPAGSDDKTPDRDQGDNPGE